MHRAYLTTVMESAATEDQMTEDREFDGKVHKFGTAKTKQDEPIDLYFDPETKLLAGYEVTETDVMMGDIRSTYTFEDFKPVDGVSFPHRVKIQSQVGKAADIQYTSVTFGESALAEEMFSFPESLNREAAKVVSGDYTPVVLFPVAPGVFQANGWSHSSMIVEFPSWLVVVEAPQGDIHSKMLDQQLKEQFPGKPVRYVAVTHPHRDHIAGVRAFAGMGATILVEKNHAAEMTRFIDARHSYPPDELERRRSSQQKVGGIEVYDGKKVISDGGRTLELYAIHPTHVPGVGDPSGHHGHCVCAPRTDPVCERHWWEAPFRGCHQAQPPPGSDAQRPRRASRAASVCRRVRRHFSRGHRRLLGRRSAGERRRHCRFADQTTGSRENGPPQLGASRRSCSRCRDRDAPRGFEQRSRVKSGPRERVGR